MSLDAVVLYVGRRDVHGACHVDRVELLAGERFERDPTRQLGAPGGTPLDPRLELRKHGPTGFEWGHAGGGPAQLALAILADATGDDDLAELLYQDFKLHLIVRLPPVEWVIKKSEVLAWVARVKGTGR